MTLMQIRACVEARFEGYEDIQHLLAPIDIVRAPGLDHVFGIVQSAALKSIFSYLARKNSDFRTVVSSRNLTAGWRLGRFHPLVDLGSRQTDALVNFPTGRFE